MRRLSFLFFSLIILSQFGFAGRYYDARIGRFLQVDPSAKNYPDLSSYAYCANNPLRNVDPDGKDMKDIVNGAVVAIASNVNPTYDAPSVNSYSGDKGDYAIGRIVGDVLSMVIGGGEMVSGGVGAGTGVVMSGSGIGALAGVPLAAASAGVAAHGTMTTVVAATNLVTDLKVVNENTNPYKGSVDKSVTVVDKNGNAIKVESGQQISSSPSGEYQQVLDNKGNPTGLRKDGAHGPNQNPHAHVPGITTETGDKHLPIK
jgi:hypothetical protein